MARSCPRPQHGLCEGRGRRWTTPSAGAPPVSHANRGCVVWSLLGWGVALYVGQSTVVEATCEFVLAHPQTNVGSSPVNGPSPGANSPRPRQPAQGAGEARWKVERWWWSSGCPTGGACCPHAAACGWMCESWEGHQLGSVTRLFWVCRPAAATRTATAAAPSPPHLCAFACQSQTALTKQKPKQTHHPVVTVWP